MQLQYLNCSASHSQLTASHAFVLVEIATVTYSMSIITVPLQKLYYDGLSFERICQMVQYGKLFNTQWALSAWYSCTASTTVHGRPSFHYKYHL